MPCRYRLQQQRECDEAHERGGDGGSGHGCADVTAAGMRERGLRDYRLVVPKTHHSHVAGPWRGVVVIALALSPVPAQSDASPPPVRAMLTAPRLDAAAFAAIVRAGDAAVPELLAILAAPDAFAEPLVPPTDRALRALRLIGPPAAPRAVPPLLAALTRDSSRDDRELLETLAILAPGVSDRQALLTATAALEIRNPNPRAPGGAEQFRRWVAKMRGWYRFRQHLADDLGGSALELAKELEHEDPLRRERAAWRLGALGSAAHAALPALVSTVAEPGHPRVARCDIGSLTADFHELVRDAAAVAIARIDPDAEEARAGLALLLAAADAPQERLAAALALGQVAGGEFDPVPALLRATFDDDLRVAGEAVTALGRVGSGRDDVLVRLRACAAMADPALATPARVALQVAARGRARH